MGDRELLYVVLAIMLFGGLSVTISKYLGMNSAEAVRAEAERQAISLAQEIIEDAKTKKFDDNTDEPQGGFDPNYAPAIFTNPLDTTRKTTSFSSIDNLNDYTDGWSNDGYKPRKTTVSTNLGSFDVSTVAYYVKPENLSVAADDRQYFKKLTVTVSNENLPEDITLEHVYAFWNL